MANFYGRDRDRDRYSRQDDGFYDDSRMEEDDERRTHNRSLSRNHNNGNNNGNGNNNYNNNGWQWLSIFLLVYSLSLQLGVFDTIKSSIGQSFPIISNEFEQSQSHHHTRPQQRQKRNLVEEEASSSAFSKSDIFESLEARHEHHLARRKAPPEHISDRIGPSSSGIITNGGDGGVKMHEFHKQYHSAEKQQQHQQQSRRREMQTKDDFNAYILENTSNADDVDTNTTSSSSIQNISANSIDSSNSNKYSTISSSSTSMEGRLRAKLLTGYDRNSYPWEWAWEQNYNNTVYDRVGDAKPEGRSNATADPNGTATEDAEAENEKKEEEKQLRVGLPVEFGLNFHKVHALNVKESTADLVVWVRIAWQDPRLQWNPEDYNGLTTTWFYISDGIGGGEASELWTPDIYLWNQEEAMPDNLANTYATVSSDGSVFWSRPGRIKSTCKYTGLENFPFDKLGCALEFGSWTHSGLYLRPTKLGGTGYSIGGSETAGGSFVEFELIGDEVQVDEVIYPPFDCCPEEDWPVLIYKLEFDRASAPYVRTIVFLNILLNLAAFACFWIPPHVGERMGLAITCVLAAVAGELVVASMLPVCAELSWYNKFTLGSTTFALLVVFQSAVVIFFFYYTGEDMTPTYVKWIKRKFKDKRIRIIEKNERKQLENEENGGMMSPPGEERQEQLKTTKTSIAGVSDNGNISDGDDGLPDDAQFRKGIMKRNNYLNGKGNSNRRGSFAESRSGSFAGTGGFRTEKEAEMNAHWQTVSGYIDEGARLFIPMLYCIFLGYVFRSRV